MNKAIFKNAKVGDRVWSVQYGWGIIDKIYKKDKYPIGVVFDNEEHASYTYYTYDGKIAESLLPTLFWNEFEIPEEAYKKPLPDLEVDTKVLVWDRRSKINTIYKRHFAGWTEDGHILT